MTQLKLRRAVERALQMEWARFSERHPRLAEVLDQELLLEKAMEQLGDDEGYQEAMAEAAAAGVMGEAVEGVVLRWVRVWLRGLV